MSHYYERIDELLKVLRQLYGDLSDLHIFRNVVNKALADGVITEEEKSLLLENFIRRRINWD